MERPVGRPRMCVNPGLALLVGHALGRGRVCAAVDLTPRPIAARQTDQASLLLIVLLIINLRSWGAAHYRAFWEVAFEDAPAKTTRSPW